MPSISSDHHGIDDSAAEGEGHPPILYKYRSWAVGIRSTEAFSKRLLTNLEVYFNSPEEFNDPFECLQNFEFPLDDNDLLFDAARRSAMASHPELSPAKQSRLARKGVKERKRQTPEGFEQNRLRYQERHYKTVGICSLTSLRDNPLMWSHYASDHKGVCVGLKSGALKKTFFMRSRTWRPPQSVNLEKVLYSRKYPKANFFDLEDHLDFLKEVVRTKAEYWNYEQEYRFVYIGGTRRSVRIPAEHIAEVILGCRADSDVESEVRLALDQNKISATLLRAVRAKNTFALEFEPA
ncbi:MAG: DUF2971 domain-containing protein [Candidatus Hydrogenedentota bacterium]